MPDMTMTRIEVAAIVVHLRLNGYKVQELEAGYSAERDGSQIFRATDMGNERYAVRYPNAS